MNKDSLYGLIGKNLGHSFSAEFFAGLFDAEDINAEYRNFQIDSIDKLPQIISENPTLKGLNVTIPYKESVIRYLDSLSEEAAKIGAVNVITIKRDENHAIILKGYNSDVFGFAEACSPHLRSTPGDALILGTGGAAKAAGYALEKYFGRNVAYVSREPGKGNYTYSELTADIIREFKVIVNATPLGMWPDTNSCPDIPYEGISLDHFCIDWVYNPIDTLFNRNCRRKGATVGSGLEILHLQAVKAWEIWNER